MSKRRASFLKTPVKRKSTGGKDPFANAFQQLHARDPTVFRVFEFSNGDYFKVLGEDALWTADHAFHSRQVVSKIGSTVPAVNINPNMLKTVLKTVLTRGIPGRKISKIQLLKRQDSASHVWTVFKSASPGNTEELQDMLHTSSDFESALTMCVWPVSTTQASIQLGVACADNSLKRFEVTQFLDNEHLGAFESMVVSHAPKECLLCMDNTSVQQELDKVRHILESSGVQVVQCKKADFNARNISQDVGRLCGSATNCLSFLEQKHAMAALAGLIRHLDALGDETAHGSWKIRGFDVNQFMKLDRAASAALNLFPSPSDGNKNMNLFGLLNKCRTAMGSRLLSMWIKQPLIDMPALEERLDFVEAFVRDTELRECLRDNLKGVVDVDRLLKKFQRHKGELKDCLSLYTFTGLLPGLQDVLAGFDGACQEKMQEKFTNKIGELSAGFVQFQHLVEQVLDLEAAERNEFVVNSSFNATLAHVDQQKRQIMRQMSKIHKQEARKLFGENPKERLKFEENKIYGYHFRVSRKDEKVIRKKAAYNPLQTQAKGVMFTTNALKQLSSQYKSVSAEYEELQTGIVTQALEVAETYIPLMEVASAVLAELDVLLSLAHCSDNAPEAYTRPTLLGRGSGKLVLKDCRHPCMEMQDHGHCFISNDVHMVKGQSQFQIITGPNMGGKSTYIRMIGVVVLMAQIGCFVPCSEATVSVVDHILARVGAGDHQLKGVSTFMAEMLEASSILKCASNDSLIIIDELGRGTSTYDGFGLAYAISTHIVKHLDSLCLFATHFHELTTLAELEPRVINKHVTASTTQSDITMLYRVNDGPCDQSFGIHVAEVAKFPADVIKMARRKVEELENLTHQEQEGESDNKKRRLDLSEAEQEYQARLLIKRFKDLPLQSMDEESAAAALRTFATEVKDLAEDNEHIRVLVERGCAMSENNASVS